jgi:hypothetical protein
MKIKAILVLSLIVSSIFATSFSLQIGKASEYTLQDLDNQISKALDWLDRFIYYEINSTNAVSSCAPFLAFRIRHANGVNWTVSDKLTGDGNSGNGGWMFKGGCLKSKTPDLGRIISPYPKICLNWQFDIDGDKNYDDIALYTEYADINDTYVKLFINCTKQNVGSNYALFFATNTTPLTANLQFNDSWMLTTEWGWKSPFYFMRPTLKGLADLYYQLNRTVNPSTGHTYAYDRGINYTDRAYKLMKTFYGTGYLLDRFDGMYNVTLKERPFADLTGGIGHNPDLVNETIWGFGPLDNSAGYPAFQYGHNYTADGEWAEYGDLGRTYDRPIRENNTLGVWRSASCSRSIMPDENWFSAPVNCDNSSNPAWCYRSRTGAPVARNCYISNGFYEDLLRQHSSVRPLMDILMGTGADSQMIRACADMYKYGINHPYGLSFVKDLIDHVVWDGNGVPVDYCKDLPWQWIGWNYPVYANHITAPYLNALVQYSKLSGDQEYYQRADEVAAVLLNTQIKQGVSFWNKQKSMSYYMPDAVGSFLAGYCVAYSFGFGDIMWEPWSEGIFSFIKSIYDLTGGSYGFRFDEFPHVTFGSAESTIPAVWSLIEYRKLNRVPPVYSQPDIVLSFSDCYAITDHGGSLGGDGLVEVLSDANSTLLGGNQELWQGKVDRIRLFCGAGADNGWASIEYQWNFTVNNTLTNTRWKTLFTVPEGCAKGNNNFNVTVTLKYRDNSTVLASTETQILNNEYNPEFHGMYALNNSAPVATLYAGNYNIKLKFKVLATGLTGGLIGLGWFRKGQEWMTVAPDMPMGLESFGLDFDHPSNIILQKFNIDKVQDGAVYVKHIIPQTVCDGRIQASSSIYANTYSFGTSFSVSTGYVGQSFSDSTYKRFREFLEFNTTLLNATVNSARLKIYCIENFASNVSWDIQVYNWTGDDPIDLNDYNQFGNTNYGFASVGSQQDGTWITINLSTSAIRQLDYTRLCLQSNRDHNNNTPTGPEYMRLGDYEDGSFYVAHLEINYGTMYCETFQNTTWTVAYPDDGKYFWFWTANNSVICTGQHPALGRFYGFDQGGWTMNATYDFNVTAWFGDYNYSKKYEGKYNFTIYCDLNFDGKVDMKDIGFVSILFGKASSDSDWYSSGAGMVDILLFLDGKIDMKDIAEVNWHYGDGLSSLNW